MSKVMRVCLILGGAVVAAHVIVGGLVLVSVMIKPVNEDVRPAVSMEERVEQRIRAHTRAED